MWYICLHLNCIFICIYFCTYSPKYKFVFVFLVLFAYLFVFVSWVFMCGLPPPAAASASIDPEVITKRPTLPYSDLPLQDVLVFVYVFAFLFVFVLKGSSNGCWCSTSFTGPSSSSSRPTTTTTLRATHLGATLGTMQRLTMRSPDRGAGGREGCHQSRGRILVSEGRSVTDCQTWIHSLVKTPTKQQFKKQLSVIEKHKSIVMLDWHRLHSCLALYKSNPAEGTSWEGYVCWQTNVQLWLYLSL